MGYRKVGFLGGLAVFIGGIGVPRDSWFSISFFFLFYFLHSEKFRPAWWWEPKS